MRSNRLAVVLAALVLVACDSDPAGLPDLSVATMEVQPGTAELAVGDTLLLTALPRTADGTVLGSVEVEWTVDVAARASAVAKGFQLRITGLEPGPVVITATSGGKSGQTAVTITAGAVSEVVLATAQLEVAEGDTVRLAATARDAYGNEVTGRVVHWTSSDASVAHIDPLGLLTAIRVGAVEITARVDGRTATASVEVGAEYGYDLLYTEWGPFPGADQPWAPVPVAIFGLDIRDASASPVRVSPANMTGTGPAPAPGGGRIAFLGSSSSHGIGIFVMNRDGSDLVLLDTLAAPDCSQISWSPDGQKLAYSCQVAGAGSHIVTMDAAGGNRTVLTGGDSGEHRWPVWRPVQEAGGYRIAYARVVDGTPSIWTMKSDGTDRQRLTTEYDDMPAWSPDGSTLVFQRIGLYQARLWLVDADGENERPLMAASPPGWKSTPSWSPDGRLIAFASNHETYGSGDGVMQIYTVWSDGTKLARRTSGDQQKFMPAWLPR